jgi:hypothetical protein
MSYSDREGLADRYLRLGLRLSRLDEGVLDAYYGPPGIGSEVDAEPMPEPSALVTDADDLLGDLGDGWLRDQVAGLRTVAGRLAGEQIGYADEVASCHGVRPGFTDDAALATAYADLDALLPGPGVASGAVPRLGGRRAGAGRHDRGVDGRRHRGSQSLHPRLVRPAGGRVHRDPLRP